MSVFADQGDTSPSLRGRLERWTSNVQKTSWPGRDNPLYSVWGGALGFWLFTLSVLKVGVYTAVHGAHAAYPFPVPLRPLLLSTPFPLQVATLVSMYLFVIGPLRRPFFGSLGWGRKAAPVEVGGRRWSRFGRHLLLGLAGAAVVIVAASALRFVPGPVTRADKHFYSSPEVRLAVSLTAVLVAPFVEELLYRGLLYVAFSRAFGKFLASLFVVAAFNAVHWEQFCDDWDNPNWGRMLTIAVLGGVCTGLRAREGRITPAYFAHLGYNFYLAATIFFNYDPVWLLMKRLSG